MLTTKEEALARVLRRAYFASLHSSSVDAAEYTALYELVERQLRRRARFSAGHFFSRVHSPLQPNERPYPKAPDATTANEVISRSFLQAQP